MNTEKMRSELIRPKRFSDIVGNDRIVSVLKNILASDETPPRLLFTGPTGAGKTTLGRLVAMSLLCEQKKPGDVEPCGTCKNCTGIGYSSGGNCSHYSEWSGGDIENTFMEDLMFSTTRADDIIFIDEYQDINKKYEAALRKHLEESWAVVIIATTHVDSIEDAMFNRYKSYHYELKRPDTNPVVEFLKKGCQAEGIKFDSLQQLTRVAEGYECEMRPCAEFPRKVRVEANGVLTDEYLDYVFAGKNTPEYSGPAWEDLSQEI